MTPSPVNADSFDMVASIPANGLSACVNQALQALQGHFPSAVLPTAQWVLGARARELGISPRGQQSANGSCRLLVCRDGWLIVNLARDSDWELLNAWLAVDASSQEPRNLQVPITDFSAQLPPEESAPMAGWLGLAGAVKARSGQRLVRRGRDMGLPVGFVASACSRQDQAKPSLQLNRLLQADTEQTEPRSLVGAKVVDLSALWAGPLCAHLLTACGAEVTTISSSQRPDGAIHGSPKLYQQLHAGHEQQVLDFTRPDHLRDLSARLRQADIVIEASRPRALQQLGLDRAQLAVAKPQIWLSLTAYGRQLPMGQWIGFGDDVAASQGLLHWADNGAPEFVGDAIADPLTGTYAALAVSQSLSLGLSGLLDLSMASVAAQCHYKVQMSETALICPLKESVSAD